MEGELREALKRLLGQFDLRGWPMLIVGIKGKDDKAVWLNGAVDDETRDAIMYAKRILQETEL